VPIYEYQCNDCGVSFEVIQRMSDEPLTTCERCGGSLRKVLHPVAIHFKGSGFYTTDYGKGSGRKAAGRDAQPESGDTSGKGAEAGGESASSQPDKPSEAESKPKEKQKAT
jgi:putative FmdB family regulatory protein